MTYATSDWYKTTRTPTAVRSREMPSVAQLAQFLNDVGKSLLPPTNGPVLGEALVRLSSTLRKHQDKELDEVLDLFAGAKTPRKRQLRQMSRTLEGVDLHALRTNEVKKLLLDGRLSKQDLVDVGSVRFGIPRSRLVRQNKQAVLETVTSAVQNEEAYHIISREAEKEGLRRARVKKLV